MTGKENSLKKVGNVVTKCMLKKHRGVLTGEEGERAGGEKCHGEPLILYVTLKNRLFFLKDEKVEKKNSKQSILQTKTLQTENHRGG